MPNHTSALRRTCLEWVSRKGNQLHTTSAQRALGGPLDLLPQVRERPRIEKCKGVFWEQTHTGTGLSLSQLFLAWRKLTNACSEQFQTLISSLDTPGSLCAALPGLFKECILRPNQTSLTRTHLEGVSS